MWAGPRNLFVTVTAEGLAECHLSKRNDYSSTRLKELNRIIWINHELLWVITFKVRFIRSVDKMYCHWFKKKKKKSTLSFFFPLCCCAAIIKLFIPLTKSLTFINASGLYYDIPTTILLAPMLSFRSACGRVGLSAWLLSQYNLKRSVAELTMMKLMRKVGNSPGRSDHHTLTEAICQLIDYCNWLKIQL